MSFESDDPVKYYNHTFNINDTSMELNKIESIDVTLIDKDNVETPMKLSKKNSVDNNNSYTLKNHKNSKEIVELKNTEVNES